MWKLHTLYAGYLTTMALLASTSTGQYVLVGLDQHHVLLLGVTTSAVAPLPLVLRIWGRKRWLALLSGIAAVRGQPGRPS